MKKIIVALLVFTLFSCSTKKVQTNNKLAEILLSKEYGGNSFEFYETITEPKEFKMLLGDEEIRKFVKPDDIIKSNFIIVNLGEKNTGGFGIESIETVEEASKIILTINVKKPKPGEVTTMAITSPYAVIKINSKKPIEIK